MTSLRKAPLNLLFSGLILTFMSSGTGFGQKVKVGELAPDFSVPSLDGERTVRLSDFRGHRVLIFTWASW